jgi:Sulfatase-modifying factor enzyme 1
MSQQVTNIALIAIGLLVGILGIIFLTKSVRRFRTMGSFIFPFMPAIILFVITFPNGSNIEPDSIHYKQPLGYGTPLPAYKFPPNSAGFFGMCGNTWDWCASAWDSHRVLRGGGYMDSAEFCKIQTRYRNSPIDRDCCVGFRIKIEIPYTN